MRKRKAEQIDEYAETQVLHDARDRVADRDTDTDALSQYVEYERELTNASPPTPARKRR